MDHSHRLACIYERLARPERTRKAFYAGDMQRLEVVVSTCLLLSIWFVAACWIGVRTFHGISDGSLWLVLPVSFASGVGLGLLATSACLLVVSWVGERFGDSASAPVGWVLDRLIRIRFQIPLSQAQAEQVVKWTAQDPNLHDIVATWLSGRTQAVLSTRQFSRLHAAQRAIETHRAAIKREEDARARVSMVHATFDQAGLVDRAASLHAHQELDHCVPSPDQTQANPRL